MLGDSLYSLDEGLKSCGLGLAEFRALGFTIGRCVADLGLKMPQEGWEPPWAREAKVKPAVGRAANFARSGADGCHGILG